jgi:hypothetical protein
MERKPGDESPLAHGGASVTTEETDVEPTRRYRPSAPDIGRLAWSSAGAEKTRRYQVSAHDIRRFSQAIGDPLLEHYDGPFGEGESDRTLVAPLLFPQVFTFEDVDPALLPADGSPVELDVRIPASKAVGGGSEYEIFQRVKAGDELVVTTRLKDVYTKKGRSGLLYFIVVETEFRNRQGEPVARELATYIKRS